MKLLCRRNWKVWRATCWHSRVHWPHRSSSRSAVPLPSRGRCSWRARWVSPLRPPSAVPAPFSVTDSPREPAKGAVDAAPIAGQGHLTGVVAGLSLSRNFFACLASPTSRLPWKQRLSAPSWTWLIRLLEQSPMTVIFGCLEPGMSIKTFLIKTSLWNITSMWTFTTNLVRLRSMVTLSLCCDFFAFRGTTLMYRGNGRSIPVLTYVIFCLCRGIGFLN